jgi:hypothetical protein
MRLELRSIIKHLSAYFPKNLFFWNHQPKFEVRLYIYTNCMLQSDLNGTSMHCRLVSSTNLMHNLFIL